MANSKSPSRASQELVYIKRRDFNLILSQLESQNAAIKVLLSQNETLIHRVQTAIGSQSNLSNLSNLSEADRRKAAIRQTLNGYEDEDEFYDFGEEDDEGEEREEVMVEPRPLGKLPFLLPFSKDAEYESYYLSDKESDDLRKKVNNTDVIQRKTNLLHKVFEEMAAKKPDQPAIVHHYQFLSYAELNQQANQLARYLRGRGIDEGDVVGIALPRSLDMVVAILAVLKCGSTYVPIDKAETERRLKFMVHNSDMRAVVTLSGDHQKFSAVGEDILKIVSLDVEKGGIAEMESGNLDILFSPHTPVHIIYSSSPIAPAGTPGYSKTILNELSWLWHNYPYSRREICCQTARTTRIDFVTELWSPLLKGIPNVLIPDEIVIDPALLVDYLKNIRVSRIQLPPSVMAMLLETYPDLGSRLPQLKTWFLRGETLYSEILERFRESAPEKNIINLYSVTEAGGIVASFDATIGTKSDGILIGRPIDNSKIYLLNDEGFQVDPGLAGQIVISSPGTEIGYLKNPTLTKSKFAKDTLTPKTSSNRKLFRTGDYGRMTADGQLIFLGRTDKQIKAYGNRINLDDISQVLLKQVQVIDAVITPSYNDREQLVFSAYLLVEDQTYSVQNWRKFLLKHMPQYMVPTKIYQLKSTARNSTTPLGAETMALHATNQRASEQERSAKPPRDETESTLIAIWQQILSREDVHINDDFFELGGNHILTWRLANRIQGTYDISLESETVYRKPTISELAVLIREARNIREKEDAVSNAEFVESFTQRMRVINREALVDKNKLLEVQVGIPTRPKFFCVHGEDGDVSFLRHWIKYLGEQPFYAFQSRTFIDGAKENITSLEALAADYVRELQKMQPRGPYYLGGYSTGGVIAFEMAQQLTQKGEQVATLTLIDTVNPILNRQSASFRNRFENLASAPAGYLNGNFLKRLTGRGSAANQHKGSDLFPETVISPNFRGVVFESLLNGLIEKYQIRPFSGSILLITSTASAAAETYSAIDRGWKGYALSLRIHEIPGDSKALIKEPNVKKLVGALLTHIESIARRVTNSAR